MRRHPIALALVLLLSPPVGAARADGAPDRSTNLVWHVEDADRRALDSLGADAPINPASVVKLATSLWALERLGAGHRFTTRFAVRGSLDRDSGVLDGDLLVFGGDDPDFHVENAWIVARAWNRAGLRVVRGGLLVDERWCIGWEGGSARAETNPERRAAAMAARLRDAFDPERWDRTVRRAWADFIARRGEWPGADEPPRVIVQGGVGSHEEGLPAAAAFVHRSNPLQHTLKRFNAYSNNDIERLGAVLGSPRDLGGMLAARWEADPSEIRFETLSGLGSNRMTPRQIVRLLHDLDAACRRLGLRIDAILPVAGCDPGTLRNYGDLPAGAVVAKTGSLTRTDGGVAVLAGVARTNRGDRFFCVAAPRAGGRLGRARREQAAWVGSLFERNGGARAGKCGARVGFSDDDARIGPGPEERLPTDSGKLRQGLQQKLDLAPGVVVQKADAQ